MSSVVRSRGCGSGWVVLILMLSWKEAWSVVLCLGEGGCQGDQRNRAIGGRLICRRPEDYNVTTMLYAGSNGILQKRGSRS